MSYRLTVLNDLPYAFWRLEETAGTSIADSSGFGFTGTLTGGTLGLPGLVTDSKAVVFTASDRFTASIDEILKVGTEDQAFSFECWIKVDSPPTAERVLMGRNINNGLVLTPGGIEFRANSSDGNTYSAFYTVTDWTQSLHVIGNYVGRNLGIIVNTREGTNEYFEGDFAWGTNSIQIGGASATSAITIKMSGPAIYKHPIDVDAASRHFDAGRLSATPLDVAVAMGATYYSFDDSTADILLYYTEDERSDFDLGVYDNVQVTDNYLVADLADGTHTSDPQYLGAFTNIAGSRIDWSGSSSITVESSLDGGATWTACTNHAQIPGVGPGAVLTNKFLTIRKRFTGSNTTGYSALLDRLSFVVYQSKTVSANLGDSTLTIYGSPVLPELAALPTSEESGMGISFAKNDYATVPPGPDGVKTVSFWLRRNAETPAVWEYYLDTRSGGLSNGAWIAKANTEVLSTGGFSATYVNGIAKTPVITDFPLGVWVHFVGVITDAAVAPLFLNMRHTVVESGSSSFAHLMLLSYAVSAREAALLYNMQRGQVKTTQLESAGFTVVERPGGIKAYSYAWSSVQNGIS